jgi:aldose 1-epimerase
VLARRSPLRRNRGMKGSLLLLLAAAMPLAFGGAKRADFGTLPDGTRVEAVDLTNAHGVSARIIPIGASVQSLRVPDRQGRSEDIVLGYDSAAEYLVNANFFGVSVGRFANRIAGASFKLDGQTYTLEKNDGANHLHSAGAGISKVTWKIESVSDGSPSGVVLSYVSPDGAGGYPGAMRITAEYSLNESNELAVEYRATTDKPTVVNLTNHGYFNLAGEGSGTTVLGQRLTIFAQRFTPVRAGMIPTGERRAVVGTPFDFTRPREIGTGIHDGREPQLVFGRGYDHNFIVDGAIGTLRPAARLEDPVSGRVMELLTTAPAVQFYTGNFLDGTALGKGGRLHRQSEALCLEPQTYPDAPNQPDFPSARLNPGETYRHRIVYRFSVASP